jgi:homoserine O-acetyltransferase
MLLDHLGVDKLFAVIGGSFGGMQVLQWCVSYPEEVRMAVAIATSAYSSPQQIAFNEVGRKAISSDPDWQNGDYYGRSPPARGLSLARMIGHITYLSDESMHQKFGRRFQGKSALTYDLESDFEVASYLKYQGEMFTRRFDANTYLYVTKALDYFDLTGGSGVLTEAFRELPQDMRFLVMAFSSDWLYPPYQSKEIVRALKGNNVDCSYIEMKLSFGHDAFLLENKELSRMVWNFIDTTARRGGVRID